MELAQGMWTSCTSPRAPSSHLSARYTIPTYFREPHKPLNVDYAAEVKKHLHIPVAVVGMITTLEEAEDIIASGRGGHRGHGQELHGRRRHHPQISGREECRSAPLHPLRPVRQRQHLRHRHELRHQSPLRHRRRGSSCQAERKNVMVVGGGPAA